MKRAAEPSSDSSSKRARSVPSSPSHSSDSSSDGEMARWIAREASLSSFMINLKEEQRKSGFTLKPGHIVLVPAATGPRIWEPDQCGDAAARAYLETILRDPQPSREHRLVRRYLMEGAEIGRANVRKLPDVVRGLSPQQLGMREATFSFVCAGDSDYDADS